MRIDYRELKSRISYKNFSSEPVGKVTRAVETNSAALVRYQGANRKSRMTAPNARTGHLAGQRYLASNVSIFVAVTNLLAVLALATVFSATTGASAKTANPKWRCPVSIHVSKNIYRCFRCGSAGNALDFWQAYRATNPYESAKELIQNHETSNCTPRSSQPAK